MMIVNVVSLPGSEIMCNRFRDPDDSPSSQIIHQLLGMDYLWYLSGRGPL